MSSLEVTARCLVGASIGALAVVAACDAQVAPVAPDYSGEPLARLRGVAIGFDDGETASGAAVRWNPQRGADLTSGPLQALPLRARPPAGVLLEVVTAPDSAVTFGFTGEPARLAEGTLFLTEGEALVGEAIDFALVHVDGEVTPGSLTAAYLGGALAPGFHLVDVRATAELTPAQASLAAGCAARGADSAACRAARLYELLPTPEDLDTSLPFFAHLRAAP